MTNQELSILLSLRDEVSAKWALLTGRIQASGREMVASFKQHWLAISAGAIAAFHLINKAWDFAEGFLKQEQARETFRSMVEGMGQDATRVFNDINQKAGGLIDDSDILEASNRALSLGVKVEALGDLMLIARAKARDLGISAKEAFELITEAVGKSSQRKIKEIGLTIDLKNESDFLKATLIAGAEALNRQNMALFTTYERMQQIQATIENVKDTIGEYVTRIGFALFGVFNLLEVGLFRIMEGVLTPLAMIEEGMRKLGLTTSFTLTHALENVMDGVQHFSDEARKGFDVATASSKELAGAMGGAKQTIKETADEVDNLSNSLKAIPVADITFASKDQEAEFKKAFDNFQRLQNFMKQSSEVRRALVAQNNAAELRATFKLTAAEVASFAEINKAFKEMTDAQVVEFQAKQQAMAGFVSNLAGVMGQSFTDVFNNTEGAGKAFFKRILIMIIDMVQGAFLAAAAMVPLKGILSFGITVAPDIGALIAGTALLQLARAFVASFHQGTSGPVYFDAPPSKNIPIMVRGGETFEVKTEAQQRVGSGSTLIINFNSPVPHGDWIVNSIKRALRDTGTTVDRLLINNRAGVQQA